MMSRTQLTPDLFFDLIDRRLTAIDICSRHDLSFDDLEAVVQSPAFQDAAARLKSVEQTRCTATDTLRRTAALRTLEDIAAQHPSCPTHTETIRLAAAQILRVTNADPIGDHQTPHQPDPQPDPDPQPEPPGRTHHPEPEREPAPEPQPEPISDWPDDPNPNLNPEPNPGPYPEPYPDRPAAAHPEPPTPPAPTQSTPTNTHQHTTPPARDLITRAGTTQPFTPQPFPGRDAPKATMPSTHTRAPPPQDPSKHAAEHATEPDTRPNYTGAHNPQQCDDDKASRQTPAPRTQHSENRKESQYTYSVSP